MTTEATPERSTERGLGMSMSLELAERVSSAANWVLIAVLIVGVLATYAIVVSGNVKDAHSRRRMAEAEARMSEAKAESAAALLEIAKAYERTALLEKEAAELKRDAAEARADQERIHERLAGRRISSDQYKIIVSALKQHPMSIIIGHAPNDMEATVYAEDITAVLEAAGSTITKSAFVDPEPTFGMVLKPTGSSDPNADRLLKALRDAGIPVKIGPTAPFVTINVWNKPSPF